jgi:hypothetical protein
LGGNDWGKKNGHGDNQNCCDGDHIEHLEQQQGRQRRRKKCSELVLDTTIRCHYAFGSHRHPASVHVGMLMRCGSALSRSRVTPTLHHRVTPCTSQRPDAGLFAFFITNYQ